MLYSVQQQSRRGQIRKNLKDNKRNSQNVQGYYESKEGSIIHLQLSQLPVYSTIQDQFIAIFHKRHP